MSTVNSGDKLTHTESGTEVEYVAALPTAGHGFIHLLKSVEGYLFRLTGDMESEFSQQGKDTTLAQDNTPGTTDEQLYARMEAMLAKALAAQAEGKAPAPVKPETTDTEPAAGTEETPLPTLLPDAAAHLDPTAPATAEPEEPSPAAPETVTPPANSIPF